MSTLYREYMPCVQGFWYTSAPYGSTPRVLWYNMRMFGKMKNYAVKKMLQSQMKDAPADQQQLIMEMVENNPELFEKISKEMQEELKKNGNNQMAAAAKVLPRYQAELQKSLSPEMKEKLAKMQGGGAAGTFNPNGTVRK